MSMYGDDDLGCSKNDLRYEIDEFLEKYPISELMQVVTDAISSQEYRQTLEDE
jgi:hypothetical protein